MGVFEGLKPEAVWGYFEEIYWIGRRNTIWRQNGMMQVTC